MHGLEFGIEIEVNGKRETVLYNILKVRADSHSGTERKVSFDGIEWHLKEDGSLPGGCEFASDRMKENDLPGIKTMLKHMKTLGLSSQGKTGLHIHVGVSRNDRDYYQELFMKNWRNLLPRILRVYSPRPIRQRFTKHNLKKDIWMGERCAALNISQYRHETVEFRVFNSQLDYRYITRAIRFACDFTKLTLAGKILKTKPGESLEQLFKRELGSLKKN